MATTKPRITVTLNERTYNVLKVIGDLGSSTMSGFISEMLDSALPTLERMAVTFQKIKQAQEGERARFLESIDDAQAAIEPVVMQTLGQFDLFLGRIEQAAEGMGGRGSCGAAAPAPLPSAGAASPPTNRGVTPTQPTPAKASRGKASRAVSEKKVLKKVVEKTGVKTTTRRGVRP